MFEISGIIIVLVVLTIALMGGFSAKNKPSRRFLRRDEVVINTITSKAMTEAEVRRYRNDKTPMVVEVDIAGETVEERRKTVAELNPGDSIYVTWSGKEVKNSDWKYSLYFVDCVKNVFGVALDKDKEELANRFDFIKDAVVEAVDKTEPRLVVKTMFT